MTAATIPALLKGSSARLRGVVPSWLRSVLSWAAVVFVGLLVAVLVLVALAPRLLGYQFVIVDGGSMEPTIPFGSLAVMRDVDPAALEVGDIVMFEAPGNSALVVTHRIAGFSEDGRLITRGDANAVDDDWLTPPDAVQKEYAFYIPRAGSIVQWLGTPSGYLFVVLVPGILIVAAEVRSILRTLRAARIQDAVG